MKLNKKVLSVGLALAMVMGMTTGAMADATPTRPDTTTLVTSDGTVTIQNTMHIDKNLTVPNVSYDYATTYIAYNNDTSKITEKTVTVPGQKTITFSSTDTVSDNNTVVKSVLLDLTKATAGYPSAGKYTFEIVETRNETGISGTIEHTDTQKYEVAVYVENKTADDGTMDRYVKGITIYNEDTKLKVNGVIFDETYSKNDSLIVTKTVSGAMADLTKEFEYTVSFTSIPKTAPAGNTITYSPATKVTRDSAGNYIFKLKTGESVSFDNVPVGTTYTITEKQDRDFTGALDITYADGTKEATATAAKGVNITATDKLIKEKKTGTTGTNEAKFTNTFEDITITGVVTNNLPFIMMILVAGASILGFALISIKRRRS